MAFTLHVKSVNAVSGRDIMVVKLLHFFVFLSFFCVFDLFCFFPLSGCFCFLFSLGQLL